MSRTIRAILILSIKYNFEQSFAVQISPLLLLKIEKSATNGAECTY
jgi:hypothetical protein